MNLGLKGKYALVTGGSHGIGLACALALAEQGCHVAICARDKKRLEGASRALNKWGVKVLAIAADVLKAEDIKRVTETIDKKWGRLHILINNVGGGGRWGTPRPEETPEAVWMDVYNKNALAAIRFTRWAVPLMRRQKWGRVVAIASIHGREGGGRPWFNMAKAAQISLMKTLAMNPELARCGMTFNSVAPGNILIPGTGWARERNKNSKGFDAMCRQQFPLGRLGTADEVANIVLFVCSKQAALLNGACIPVDGAESRSF